MNPRQLELATIGIGCACLVMANLAGHASAALIAKFIASTGFVALAISSDALRSRYGRLMLSGLCLSWAGDIFLELESQRYFLPGLASFLLAHICYAVAFVIHGVRSRTAAITAVPVVLASGVAMLWLSPYVSPSMTLPVWTYVIVISVMVSLAWGARGDGGTWFIPIGATLFYLSDLSVATGQFVKPDFPNYIWGLPFYYAAQALLALSMVRSMSRFSSREVGQSTPETAHP